MAKKKKQTQWQKNAAAIKAAQANALPDWLQPLSMEEIQRQARAMAMAAYNPAQTAIQAQIDQAQAESNRRAQVAGSIFSGLAGSLGNISPQIQNSYQTAATGIQQAGQGFSDTYRELADANAA